MGDNDFLEIYLDNSATTKPCKEAVEAATEMMTSEYGNPSSLHKKGFNAQQILESSRKTVADSLGVQSKCIYFTSGGTASNNTAVFSGAKLGAHKGNKIVTTALEHPSVSKCMDELELQGFEVVRLKPEKDGNIPIEKFEAAIDEKTILVSLMAVNNEVGSILPFDKIKKIINKNNSPALLHVDAVQAYLKTELSPEKSGIDLLSVSAHKVHALKGTGALYVAPNVRLKPYIFGGGQENGLVSGTQAMPGIAAFAAAVKTLCGDTGRNERVRELKKRLLEKAEKYDFVSVNSPKNAIDYILNISVRNIPSQVGVNFFSENGIYISAGSACAKGHRSEALTAMGLDSKRIDSALRISFSCCNTAEEIDCFSDCLEKLGALLG